MKPRKAKSPYSEDVRIAMDAAAPGVAGHLLGGKERASLSIIAKQAWEHMRSVDAIEESETFDAFRHRIALAACGRRISEAPRKHYNTLKAAFTIMIPGGTKKAVNAAERSLTEGKRIAMRKLSDLLSGHGVNLAYAEPVMRNYYGVSLDDATAKQVWAVYFELKKRKRLGNRIVLPGEVEVQP